MNGLLVRVVVCREKRNVMVYTDYHYCIQKSPDIVYNEPVRGISGQTICFNTHSLGRPFTKYLLTKKLKPWPI